MTITQFVHGHPKGQPRPRAFVRGNRAAVYDPGTAEGWKSQIAIAMREHEGRMLEGPIATTLSFRMPRPKFHYNSKGVLKPNAPSWHVGKPDMDNLAKAVLDALTQIRIWKDDSQVCDWHGSKTYSETPGCLIEIRGIGI